MRTLGQLGEVAGMAASICQKHGCTPRQVYTGRLDELKELMRQGNSEPWYHGWMPGYGQNYHIKELGQIQIPDGYKRIVNDPELRERVEKLDLIHLDGKKICELKKEDFDK